MMDNLSHFEFLMLAITLVGGWEEWHADDNKLAARVDALENDNTEFKEDVKQLLKDIQEIKLLLAKNQMQ